MGKITDAIVFTLFSGSLFAIGFSRGLTNVRNKESMPNEKKSINRPHHSLSSTMESGEFLAMRALKKATVYSVVGCSLVGFIGYLLFKSLNIQKRGSRMEGRHEGGVNELDELRALIIKSDE